MAQGAWLFALLEINFILASHTKLVTLIWLSFHAFSMAEQSPEVRAIISQVQEWLNSINYTLKLDLKETDPNKGLIELHVPGRPNQSLFVHDDETNKTYFNIGFSKKILPSSTVHDLQQSFQFVALDKLPMTGFNCPQNWSINPLTHASSFKEGVTILSFENNRIQYTIDTNFFSVYGNIPSQQLVCGPSPDDTYFQLEMNEKTFRGIINIDMVLSYQ